MSFILFSNIVVIAVAHVWGREPGTGPGTARDRGNLRLNHASRTDDGIKGLFGAGLCLTPFRLTCVRTSPISIPAPFSW